VSPTPRQVTGDRGERAVIRHVACPRCNRTKQLAQLPRNFQCADVISKFCGFLAQVKTAIVAAQAAGPPNTILGAAWRPQHEQIIAGIYQSLYIVGLTKAGGLVRIDYVPAHILQATPTVFAPREPLSQKARRAGWQGFMLRIDRLPEIGIHQVYPGMNSRRSTPRRDQHAEPASVSRFPSLAIATKGLGPVRELFSPREGSCMRPRGRMLGTSSLMKGRWPACSMRRMPTFSNNWSPCAGSRTRHPGHATRRSEGGMLLYSTIEPLVAPIELCTGDAWSIADEPMCRCSTRSSIGWEVR
jgi:hypothetical protein